MDQADVQRLARYNDWQNRLMQAELAALPPQDLTVQRGAFFGSILATANHLLWADRMWLSRLSDVARPEGGIADSVALTDGLAEWSSERQTLDAHMLGWADALGSADLAGDLRWWSGASGREQQQPKALCIAHMFNHQTHHRGQIHAMVTSAGGAGWVSDLFLMPSQ
ncbi:DinB family protein [Alloyangia pacifica]|uniref:DinB family protein n=1 Tax=Alloyangia pacifica TaxID=311180 RepID=UPI001CD4BC93|nr:DinB family protein [Alloyangia pacifica]MCA0994680.1 DinB family protein [Alloyangia pacifica]